MDGGEGALLKRGGARRVEVRQLKGVFVFFFFLISILFLILFVIVIVIVTTTAAAFVCLLLLRYYDDIFLSCIFPILFSYFLYSIASLAEISFPSARCD